MTCDIIFDINNVDKKDISIKNKSCFIIIDTETCNGIDKKNNAIVQLAFKFIGTDFIFNSYCKPNENIPWRTKYERYIPTITKEKVNDSPFLKNVLISFNNIINCLDDINPIFIAHNSDFDKDILELCFNNYNIKLHKLGWSNTMDKSFFDLKDKNNKSIKSLEKISKYLFKDLNIEFHNAKNDVENLYNCLLKVHKDDEKIISIVLNNFKITNSINLKNIVNVNFYFYAVILTLDPKKKDVKDKSLELLHKRIIIWTHNIKNIDQILYNGPFNDIGKYSTNVHVNITIKTHINDIEIIKDTYFKSWCLRKGYVYIKKIYNFEGWMVYSQRNHININNDLIKIKN